MGRGWIIPMLLVQIKSVFRTNIIHHRILYAEK